MWELDNKKGWVQRNWGLQTVVLEKTLESPFYCKEIKPVNLKGNQPWIFIGRTDDKMEAPILGPPDVKTHWKRSWCWEILKARGEGDEMVGWHHWLNGHEFEQILGYGEGQGSLVCYSPWGHKESYMTEQLDNNNRNLKRYFIQAYILMANKHIHNICYQ